MSTKTDQAKKQPLFDDSGFPTLKEKSYLSRAYLGLPAIRFTKLSGESRAFSYGRFVSFCHAPNMKDKDGPFELLSIVFDEDEVAIRGKGLSSFLRSLQLGMIYEIKEISEPDNSEDCTITEIQFSSRE